MEQTAQPIWSGDPHQLERFIEAQEPLYAGVLRELRRGRKRTHWMWFIFPQYEGLGYSEMSRYFSIKSLAEARAYAAHPVLGPRLRECTLAVRMVEAGRLKEALGEPDDMKFGSCMTLFELATDGDRRFGDAIEHHFGGVRDAKTLKLLADAAPPELTTTDP